MAISTMIKKLSMATAGAAFVALGTFASAQAATFTVADDTNGPSFFSNTRGQAFTPSVAGPNGSNSSGAGSTVYLQSFTFDRGIIASNPIAESLYIYSSLPTFNQLNNGLGNVLGTSLSNTVSGTKVTYNFSNLALNRTSTYFALFTTDQLVQNTGGNTYSGGSAYSATSPSLFASGSDRRFSATLTTTPVPEPTTTLGLLAFGAMGASSMLKRKQ